MSTDDVEAVSEEELIEVFRVLGDRIRWTIVRRLAEVEEVPAALFEATLPVSKPTISYHIRMLRQIGLISVRKQGRHYFYSLQRALLQELLHSLWAVARPDATAEGERADLASLAPGHQEPARSQSAADGGAVQVVRLPTW